MTNGFALLRDVGHQHTLKLVAVGNEITDVNHEDLTHDLLSSPSIPDAARKSR